MKKIKPILLIFLSLIIYIYVCNITFIPNNIILFNGEQLNVKTIAGVKIKQNNNYSYNVMQTSTSSNLEQDANSRSITLNLELFGTIPLKEINVNLISKTNVIPLGKSIGLRLYTNGVMVVGMSEIKDQNNNKYKPYENCGIEEGDTIIAVNNVSVSNTQELINNINKSNGIELEIQYLNKELQQQTAKITPIKISENEYKIGLWVRDAAEGVGTVAFYEPSTGMFAALGHPITDVDTGGIINISKGELVTSNIVSITKGEKGNPGEIRGKISSGTKLGEISENTSFGIFGKITNKSNLESYNSEEMEVALRSEIELGKAYILCELDTRKSRKI